MDTYGFIMYGMIYSVIVRCIVILVYMLGYIDSTFDLKLFNVLLLYHYYYYYKYNYYILCFFILTHEFNKPT